MGLKSGSASVWVAGFLSVLIAYAGPLLIFIQAAQVGRIADAELISWIWAISIGSGLSGLLLSAYLKLPIITAWSAPGTALLLTLFPQISMPEVVGAYLSAALIIVVIGLTGGFEKILSFIPKGIAGGMMAGILLQFGMATFKSSTDMPAIVLVMFAVYLLGKRFLPRYAIVLVALSGFVMAMASGQVHMEAFKLELASPVWVSPEFNIATLLSLTLPLVLVSLTGQYLPGMAVLQLAGYPTPSRPVLAGTGLASMLVACFGGITIVLSSITAALCTGKDAHPDPDKRYVAGIANGVFYLLGGTFAGSIVYLFTALPASLIAALAGLALIGAIVANMRVMVSESGYIEPSVITFLTTASGMSLFGLGAAFWGVVFGLLAYRLLGSRHK
ncbi:benzoate/H(+) symporter BenE family transporter [Providencia rettgeri]|uniref:benzoate/H(+) symporter BenE family transporter n=1 Tax=Alcaligenes sp. SORT26 TaxID=2813780 RepID=UPI001A9D18EE|nr:benzoate/H(+) symporter BenE family transporter [Alcaligenes sp. SORT26]MBY6346365.1 benzoate/H(+) symporter BenE family transporter [Providencia rettgeri]QTC00445.1 benzoate/H(+) symporter BenE family transporter [Alcaligenes sp. SORT26]